MSTIRTTKKELDDIEKKHTTNDWSSVPRDVDSLIAALPASVRDTLAGLDTVGHGPAETTIGLLPFGRRALLEAVKVTHTTALEDGVEGARRERISITDWGWQVIRACGAYEEPEIDEREQEERAAELRAQLSAVPPRP